MERVEHRIKLNLMKTGLQGQVNVKKQTQTAEKFVSTYPMRRNRLT